MKEQKLRVITLLCLILLVSVKVSLGQQKTGGLTLEPFTVNTGGEQVEAERGRLLVPERHANPTGKLIELAFIRYKSKASHPEPPVIYLAGGPGGSGISEAERFFPVVKRLLEQSDVIAFDQRGTGRSKPFLGCEDVINFSDGTLASRENLIRFIKENFQPCAGRWRKAGVDVSAYNTNESADDLDDLRRALGLKKVSLWGYSYGTHLALAAIKRHGAHLQRVVLAGVEGPDDTLKLPLNLQAQLLKINELVKADRELSLKIPDFLRLMKRVLDDLDKSPVLIEIKSATTAERQQVRVGKYALSIITAFGLGRTQEIAMLPALYYSISQGKLSLLARAVQRLQFRINSPFPWAMSFSMDCASGVSTERARRIKREEKQSLLGDAANFTSQLCSVWEHTDLGRNFRSPVRTEVPALFINGTLDSNTPIKQALEIQRGFPHSQLLVIEGAGHEDLLTDAQVADAIANFCVGRPLKTKSISLPPIKFAPLSVDD